MQPLSITEVPTISLGHLSPYQVRAFMIADNRLTENSSWNEILLGEQLKALSEVELDFSLETTGFEMAEIDLRIEGLEPSTSAARDPADLVPEASAITVTKLGDWWKLGHHCVLCGNALDWVNYARLMGDRLASVVFVDPPFNVRVNGHATGLGKKQHREFAMASGEMSKAEFTDFLRKACTRLARSCHDGAIHFICMDWRHLQELLEAGLSVYEEYKNLVVWAKDNGAMGSFTSGIFIAGAVRRDMNSARIGWHSGNYMTADSAVSVVWIGTRRLWRNSCLAGFLKNAFAAGKRLYVGKRGAGGGSRILTALLSLADFLADHSFRRRDAGRNCTRFAVLDSAFALSGIGLGLRCCSSRPCACQFRNARGSREKRAYSLHTASPRMQSFMGRL